MRTHLELFRWWWLGVGTICFLCVSAVVWGAESARLESLEQLTRIQIPVSSGSSFRMMAGKTGELTLIVDRLAGGALDGVPAMRDSRVRSVELRALGLDRAELRVAFTDPAIESFAYRQGNSLVVDLWKGDAAVAKSPAVKPGPPKKAPPRAPASAHRAPPQAPPHQEPKPALPGVKPLRMGQDLFQRFLLPVAPLEYAPADGTLSVPLNPELEKRLRWSRGDPKTEAGKSFEFAKRLFRERKYGLCLKAIEILRRDHPKSLYDAELLLLQALSYRRLGALAAEEPLQKRAEKQLEELAARRDEAGKGLPFQRELLLHFASQELKRERWIAAVSRLEEVAVLTPQAHPEFPAVQMALADAYGKLAQPRRAERLHRFVAEKFPRHPLAREARYRTVGLLALEKNYRRVIEEGALALREYPEHEKQRPEALFHQGEAQFWLGRYQEAEQFFRRFTRQASTQTVASLAWVRIGEIQELTRGDLSAARASYLRAKNSYPFSKGDLVATVRLARIDLPGEKEPGFVVRTLKELLADGSVEWDLKRMAELTLIDYLMLSGETKEAVEIASRGMGQTEGVVSDLYRRAYEAGLFRQLEELVQAKKFPEALAFHENFRSWLQHHGPDSFRVLAEAYRGLGLHGSALQFLARYQTEAAKAGRKPASGTADAATRRERAESLFARGAYAEVLAALDGLRDPRAAYLRALTLSRQGRGEDAAREAGRILRAPDAARSGLSDASVENLAEILIHHAESERDFDGMERDVQAARALCKSENDRLSFAFADSLWYRKRHAEAEKAYRAALEKFPASARGERARYHLGLSLLAMGKRDEAVKALTELRNSGQGVWPESARQELELVEWERKYSSVLRTLPPGGLGIRN